MYVYFFISLSIKTILRDAPLDFQVGAEKKTKKKL